jgi:hypothetical protein
MICKNLIKMKTKAMFSYTVILSVTFAIQIYTNDGRLGERKGSFKKRLSSFVFQNRVSSSISLNIYYAQVPIN